MASHVDREPTKVQLPAPTSFHKGLIDNVSDGNIHDIKDFLKRPVIVKTGDWSSTQVVNSEINSVEIPLDILNVGKVLAQKVTGFLGFRATVVLRLQVNTNRFQQGRLMMTYFPMLSISQAKHYTISKSLILRTQLPRVDFDAATDTEVLLEIPYISPTMAFNTTDGSGSVGHVGLIVYDPLNAASGELSAEYTLWAHFEDVELLYPAITNTTVLPQSGNGRGRRMRVGNKEATSVEANSSGFISSSLLKVSKAASIMGEIPLISSICAPVSWAASVGSRAASALGFSNPLTSSQITPVIPRPWIRGPNASGLDASYNLGVFEDNHIENLDGFAGQSVDEMALAYPLSIPTWFATFTWVDTAPTYTNLQSIPLTPYNGPFQFTDSNAITFNSPLSLFAKMFSAYRGSIRIKLKFVKTEFHSGRLLIAFAPFSGNGAPTTLSAANISYLHREIVDIRSTNEVEFTAPWAATVPYNNVGTSYGTVYILVLNELRHPDTVLSSVNVICEVSCADDFEFAIPRDMSDVPVLYGTSAIAQSGNQRARRRIVPQGGDVSEGQEVVTATAQPTFGDIGGSHVLPNTNIAARACIGERVLSLRQLAKRATKFGYVTTGPSAGRVYSFYPWYTKIAVYNDTTSSVITPKIANTLVTTADYYDVIVGCYAFMRGSIRLKFQFNDNTMDAWGRLAYSTNTQPATARFDTNYTLNNTTSGVPWDMSTSPWPELQVPYYNKTHMSVVGTDCSLTSNSNIRVTADNTFRPNLQVTSNPSFSSGHGSTIYRAVGDDFSCGFWTGAICTAPNTSVFVGTGVILGA